MTLNTRTLMGASGLALGVAGTLLLFLPDEIAGALAAGEGGLALQLVGAAWYGFAIVDWTARGSVMGGIYGRPLVLGNATLYMVSALVLGREGVEHVSILVIAGAVGSALFAVAFGYLLFRHPGPPRGG